MSKPRLFNMGPCEHEGPPRLAEGQGRFSGFVTPPPVSRRFREGRPSSCVRLGPSDDGQEPFVP